MKPKITCVITTYNRAKILKERSLASVVGKDSIAPYEILVIDDCSTDDTEQVVRIYQNTYKNIRYYRHEKNKGLAGARNTGSRLAQGEYIVFLDDDDILVDSFFLWMPELTERFPDKKVFLGGRIVVYPEIVQYYPQKKIDEKTFYVTLDDGFLIKKEIFNEIQYDEELLTNEDADFGIQFMRKFGYQSFLTIANPTIIKYAHEIGSKQSWSTASQRTLEGMDKYFRKNWKFYQESNNKEEIEYILRYMGRLNCEGGKMMKGISYLLKAVRTKPMPKNFSLLLFALGGNRIFKRLYKIYETKRRTKEF